TTSPPHPQTNSVGSSNRASAHMNSSQSDMGVGEIPIKSVLRYPYSPPAFELADSQFYSSTVFLRASFTAYNADSRGAKMPKNPLDTINIVARVSFSIPICLGTTEPSRKLSAAIGRATNNTIFRII
ncbi:hypothetical protein OAF83_03120, partial [Rubripirellula sp.]